MIEDLLLYFIFKINILLVENISEKNLQQYCKQRSMTKTFIEKLNLGIVNDNKKVKFQ